MCGPDDSDKTLGEQIRETVEQALARGHANVAAAINIGGDSQSTSVYTDDDVTIVQHNGETHVVRRHEDPVQGD